MEGGGGLFCSTLVGAGQLVKIDPRLNGFTPPSKRSLWLYSEMLTSFVRASSSSPFSHKPLDFPLVMKGSSRFPFEWVPIL